MPSAPDLRPSTGRNLALLMAAQTLAQSGSITSVSVSGLAGAMLAPEPALATLPFALISVGIALSTIPASFLMEATSRRTGFLLGAFLGVVSAVLALTALFQQSFWLLCLASPFQGAFQATSMYYRYGAVEAVKGGNGQGSEGRAGRAISLVLLGGVIAALAAPTAARYANEVIDVTAFAGPYALMMVVALAAFVPLLFLRLPPMVATGSGKDTGGGDDEDSVRSLAVILRSPKGLTAVTCNLTAWSIMVLLMSGVPLSMKNLGFGYADSSIVIQWHVMAMYAPSFFTGRLIARAGLVPVLFTGVGVLAIALVFGFSADSIASFAIALALIGLGWNFLYISALTLLTEAHRPGEKAKTQAANEFLAFGASAIGAVSSGAVVAAFGWRALNVIAASILLLAFLVVIRYARSVREERDWGPDMDPALSQPEEKDLTL